ncbi:hypothetical protein L6452_04922 [Arctium lappa]|uniref:Uncharacterized protein n=1 Tax=Arctium lappa TaxID=4217 RepID=A0ACB9EFE6_ARCLA|nr:hypothetical protein L6452_04922 [Arctium lappa]
MSHGFEDMKCNPILVHFIDIHNMAQEIKLKVSIHCEKCKIEVMKTVAELSGVDEIYVDLEKEILVVVGDVDPVSVATRLRKKRRVAEILSVRKHRKKDKILINPRVYYNNFHENGYEQVFRYPPSHGGGDNCNIL